MFNGCHVWRYVAPYFISFVWYPYGKVSTKTQQKKPGTMTLYFVLNIDTILDSIVIIRRAYIHLKRESSF